MNKLPIIFLVFVACSSAFGQAVDNSCKSASSGAKLSVEFFLTFTDRQVLREQSGTINELVSDIKAVDGEEACESIDNLLDSTTDFEKMNDHYPDSRLTVYYYETSSFYYVFRAKKPEYDGIPSTGPKTRFLVIPKDLSKIWKFYL